MFKANLTIELFKCANVAELSADAGKAITRKE